MNEKERAVVDGGDESEEVSAPPRCTCACRGTGHKQATREDEMSDDDDGNSTSKSVIHRWMSESMGWCRIRV